MVRPGQEQCLAAAVLASQDDVPIRRRRGGRGGARVRRVPGGPPRAADGTTSSRGWCLTVFAGDQPDLTSAEDVFRSSSATYWVFGREMCPESLRPHLQAYVYFKGKKTKQ